MIRFALIVELIIIFAFFYNTLITLIAMLAKVGFEIRWWLVALLAMVLGIPGSWYLWYKSLFGSARTDGSTFSYMKTFLLIFVQIVWCGWMVAAIPGEALSCLSMPHVGLWQMAYCCCGFSPPAADTSTFRTHTMLSHAIGNTRTVATHPQQRHHCTMLCTKLLFAWPAKHRAHMTMCTAPH